jgi:D-arabinose 5-phosphate isomerase GutQ
MKTIAVAVIAITAAVSTVIAKTAETSLTLPAASVACAVTLCKTIAVAVIAITLPRKQVV